MNKILQTSPNVISSGGEVGVFEEKPKPIGFSEQLKMMIEHDEQLQEIRPLLASLLEAQGENIPRNKKAEKNNLDKKPSNFFSEKSITKTEVATPTSPCPAKKKVTLAELKQAWKEYLVRKSRKLFTRTSSETNVLYAKVNRAEIDEVKRFELLCTYVNDRGNDGRDFQIILKEQFGHEFFAVTERKEESSKEYK